MNEGPVNEGPVNEDTPYGLDRRLDRSSVVIAVIAIGTVFVLVSARAAASIAAGALLSYVNFRWLKQAVDFVVLEGALGGTGKRVFVRFVGRYALIGVFLYVTIRSSVLEIVFVFAGLLVYVGAILVECVSEVCRVLIKDFRNGRT